MKSITCRECKGERINADARSVTIHGKTISQLTKMELNELIVWFSNQNWDLVSEKIVSKISNENQQSVKNASTNYRQRTNRVLTNYLQTINKEPTKYLQINLLQYVSLQW